MSELALKYGVHATVNFAANPFQQGGRVLFPSTILYHLKMRSITRKKPHYTPKETKKKDKR